VRDEIREILCEEMCGPCRAHDWQCGKEDYACKKIIDIEKPILALIEKDYIPKKKAVEIVDWCKWYIVLAGNEMKPCEAILKKDLKSKLGGKNEI
jgi:hypothetical protein